MKVALIRKEYTLFGGAERYLDSLVKQLLTLGHEVHIFAHHWQPATGNSQIETGKLFFHRVPMIKGLSVLEALSFAINARRFVKRERFDVIHSFERTLYQDIYRAGDGCHKEWLVQRTKYEPLWKTVLVRVNPLHRVLLWIEKRLFDPKNTRLIIANSNRGKEEIVRHYGFPEDKIRVVYNGVDTDRFNVQNRKRHRDAVRNMLGFSPSDHVILFLGSGFERKGLSFALKMVEAFGDSCAKLVVAGRDNPRRYRKLARQLGINDRVIFLGPTKEPEKLYAAADVFLLPTMYEPFSNACLEALASGLPVVTSRINGVSEMIQDNVTGECLDSPASIDDMVEAVKTGLERGNKAACFWAKENMQRLSVAKHVEKTLDIYSKILKRS